ncbi:MAG TPA: twin-arginine translocation signal domain-containing protein, partial [Anaerolineales bacterium]|nr:twin-arginine translocation signal domain-containing protein [Anaerolineales bacterium]
MDKGLSRRGFLKLAGLTVGGLALRPVPPDLTPGPEGLGRVAASWVSVYTEPSFRSRRLTTLTRDSLLTLLSREVADEGPTYNPIWYRIAEGHTHSGNLQLV